MPSLAVMVSTIGNIVTVTEWCHYLDMMSSQTWSWTDSVLGWYHHSVIGEAHQCFNVYTVLTLVTKYIVRYLNFNLYKAPCHVISLLSSFCSHITWYLRTYLSFTEYTHSEAMWTHQALYIYIKVIIEYRLHLKITPFVIEIALNAYTAVTITHEYQPRIYLTMT